MQRAVTLSRQATRRNGKTYSYWVLRWYGADGRRRSQHLGRVGEVGKRQAEKRRREKERELEKNPGRRDVARSPELGAYLQQYYAGRKAELAAGTLELHRQTGRYLTAFLGEHRRLDSVTRAEARAFKTALGSGELAHVNQRRRAKGLEATTVDQHVRHARKMFNHALDDDLITFNPFDRLGASEPVAKDWHFVSPEEFARLMGAARPAWKLLLGLARWAALRLEEALELPWRKIDWQNRRLTLISRDGAAREGAFRVKDKDARVVPICPELYDLLRAAYDADAELVIPRGALVYSNHWRDFEVIRRRAGVEPYAKPIHALRKSCITDWAARFPAHVVREWAGHADIRTTLKYYLKVSESEYQRAAGLPLSGGGRQASAEDYERAARVAEPGTREREGAEADTLQKELQSTEGESAA